MAKMTAFAKRERARDGDVIICAYIESPQPRGRTKGRKCSERAGHPGRGENPIRCDMKNITRLACPNGLARAAMAFTLVLMLSLGSCKPARPSEHVRSISDREFDAAISNTSSPVFILFYASWCHICQAFEPELEKQAGPYSGKIEFYKIDLDQSPILARRYSVRGVPVLFFFKDGKLVDKYMGSPTPDELHIMLEKFAGMDGGGKTK